MNSKSVTHYVYVNTSSLFKNTRELSKIKENEVGIHDSQNFFGIHQEISNCFSESNSLKYIYIYL